MTTLVLHLPFPVSVNAMYANNRGGGKGRYPTKKYKDWKQEAALAIKNGGFYHMAGEVSVAIYLGRPDKRKRDCDNLIKGVLDALTQNKVIEDDHKVIKVSVEWADVTGAKVEITNDKVE